MKEDEQGNGETKSHVFMDNGSGETKDHMPFLLSE